MKVAVGMSGGVDSSVAAALLKEQGYDVVGLTLKLCGDNDCDCKDAASVCEKLSVLHKSVDFKKEFESAVIDNFIGEYERGATPNPCIVCNKKIKFGKMLDFAKENGCEKIATGHYVRTAVSNGRTLLLKAKDTSKDQSYVLYSLSQEQLSSSIFPLGDLKKSEIREYADKSGLITAHKSDSQDICFVPDGDYAGFITNKTGKVYSEGNFISESGEVIGKHSGIINYTVGQRKGLGIALGHPVFVLDKNVAKNTVTVGGEENLFYKYVNVENVNYIPFENLSGDIKVSVKLRYRQTEQPAVLHPTESGITVEFNDMQRAPSIGQSAVFYDGDTVIGGGIISGAYNF